MHFIQSLYTLILNPAYKITCRIDGKIRNAIVLLTCISLAVYFVLFFTEPLHDYMRRGHTFNSAICSIVLFILIVFSIKGELKPVKWNKLVFYLFFLAGLGVVIISFLHPIGSGYRAWGLLMMFGFPCIYFVWNNRGDYDVLYKRLAAANVLVGVAFYIYCFIYAANGGQMLEGTRIKCFFYDSNQFSMIGMIMVSCTMYMLLVNRHSKSWFALTALGFGIGIDIVFLGESRLSILVVAGSLLAFTIYYIKCGREFHSEKSRSSRWIRAEILLISLIVFIFAGRAMISINERAISQSDARVASVEIVVPSNVAIPEGSALDRFDTEGQDLNSYTAGRYNIWKNYAQFLNMTGNDYSKSDWAALTGNTVKHAHNNFLEIGYRCGVPVAILHTVLELVAGIICLIWLFGRKYKEPAYLFAIVFMITYTVQSLFDIATMPFERPAPFFFYMAMIPIFMFGSNKSVEEHKPKH